MTKRSAEQRLLDVIPLAKNLTRDDLATLRQNFPEFDIPKLLEDAGVLGNGPSAYKNASDDRRLGLLKLELQIALLSLNRVLPQCEQAWTLTGARLHGAAKIEFFANLISLVGGGGAAGAGGSGHPVSAIIAGVLAVIASSFLLFSKWLRNTMHNDKSLASLFGEFAEARGRLHQLKDSLELYSAAPDDLLLGSEDKVYGSVKSVAKVTAEIESSVSLVAPLLRS